VVSVLVDLYDLALLAGYCVAAGLRGLCGGKPIGGLAEKISPRPRDRAAPPCIWVHAVSVGEVRGARSLVAALREARPDVPVLVSTTTATGHAEACRLFGDLDVRFWPLDASTIVEAALRRIRPAVVVLMELEMWPNFARLARRFGVPVVVVNGRITERAFRRYCLCRYGWARVFNSATVLAMQTDTYAARLLQLGVDPERIVVNGTMKYDTIRVGAKVPGAAALAKAVGLREQDAIWVCGSTAAGEEATCLEVYRQLRGRHPALKLVLVPRHPERFDAVATLVRQRGFLLTRRSEYPDEGAPAPRRDAVVLGDTMGELTKFYQLASLAFVGRSLVPAGGSDMIEAAALGRVTLFGPHTFNFAEPVRQLLAADAAVCVYDAPSMVKQLDRLLADPKLRRTMARRAMKLVRDNKGATARNVELILKAMDAASPTGVC
jgi:3-deoxy-D-manno-octulosonic-acid transferase